MRSGLAAAKVFTLAAIAARHGAGSASISASVIREARPAMISSKYSGAVIPAELALREIMALTRAAASGRVTAVVWSIAAVIAGELTIVIVALSTRTFSMSKKLPSKEGLDTHIDTHIGRRGHCRRRYLPAAR